MKLTKKEIEGIALKLQNKFRDSWDLERIRKPDPYWLNIVRLTLKARDALFEVKDDRWEVRTKIGVFTYARDESSLARNSVDYRNGESLVRVTTVARKKRKTNQCAACGRRFWGKVRYGIHRDGMGVGPEVNLCTPCGGSELPTCEDLWKQIAERRRKL